ncbi:MAG: type II toxin-antitoxin system VapC family toxin [Planctomycetes bacterium]|nr:type II toxin-antitoxin system VapC family toxin [Planctomycetota bacterium]
MTKYAIDTNLYVDALRNPERAVVFQSHYRKLAPALYMSAVVVEELLAGAVTAARARTLTREVLESFERTGRVVTPSYGAWKRSGNVLASLARREGLDLRRVPKSFVNDVLLAVSCREAGLTLITENLDDFARIRREFRFEFVAPWPIPPEGPSAPSRGRR